MQKILHSRSVAVVAGAALLVTVGGLSAAVADRGGSGGGNPHYQGANWGIVDRNVIGAADSYLRAGPVASNFERSVEPPYGVGSLGIRTASGEDNAEFGNQVDFVGDLLADVTTVSYSVYTTAENESEDSGGGEGNLPNIKVEIDPSGADDPEAPNYSTLVFEPAGADANQWTLIDATTADRWRLTGTTGTSTGCNQTTYCTLDEVQEELSDATIFTVAIGKGRDYAFSGAVDGLTWGDATYDFEPNGVRIVR